MRKKFLAMTVAAAFCLGSLTACGGSDADTDTTEATTAAEAVTEEETTEAAPATQEIEANTGFFIVTAEVPADSDYAFTEEQPENLKMNGSVYMTSSKILASFSSDSWFGDTKTYDGTISFITSDDYTGTIKEFDEIEIDGRKGIKYDYRYGSGSGDLYGYTYVIDFPEGYEGCTIKFTLSIPDGNFDTTESVFAEEEVKAFIDSLKFTKSDGKEEDTTEATTEAEEATPAEAVDGYLLQSDDVSVVVNSDFSKGDWYNDDSYGKSGSLKFYNVKTKDDAYSNSPRIGVELCNPDSMVYWEERMENVVEIDSKTIGGIELKGRTYDQVGMEWTEYYGVISGDEYIRVRISGVDITDGTDGANVLDNMTLEVK